MKIIIKSGFEKAYVPTKFDKSFSVLLGRKYREVKKEQEKYDFINKILFTEGNYE